MTKAVEQYSLDPCPFCGVDYPLLHEAEEVDSGKYRAKIECTYCWAVLVLSRPSSTPLDAVLNVVKTWNDRP